VGVGRLSWESLLAGGKIREAAERVARSEGLEVVDVEWKIATALPAGVHHRVPVRAGEISPRSERRQAISDDFSCGLRAVNKQLSVILMLRNLCRDQAIP
jgi:hypothetical protein